MKKFFLTILLVVGVLSFFDANTTVEKISAEKVSADETQAVAPQKNFVAVNGVGVEVAAANPAEAKSSNWDDAPRFNNYKSLVDYLNGCRKNLRTTVPVILTDDFKPDVNEVVKLAPIWYLKYTIYGSDGHNTKAIYEITNYPGERVAWAYKQRNTSFLTAEERELYNTAVQIINEAKSYSNNLLYQELYIHDAITERANYYTENPQPTLARFQSAIGALIDGRANCQGYSDAFYMLGNMCGINVDKVNGYGNDQFHVWNTVNFGDGRNYFTDVTWDDASFSFADSGEYNTYIYFNAPTDVMTTHRWFVDYSPQNLQQIPDGRYFYYTQEFMKSNGQYFGGHSATATDALDYIAYRIAQQDYRMSWICSTSYDAKFTDANAAVNYLTKNVLPNKYGWRGYVKLNVAWRGKYMFFTVDATPR